MVFYCEEDGFRGGKEDKALLFFARLVALASGEIGGHSTNMKNDRNF